MLAWYAVYTAPQREKRVEFELKGLGLQVYLPLSVCWKRRARKKERDRVTSPLFARYLFVALDKKAPQFHAVRATDGVEAFVSVCGSPVIVPSAEIDRLVNAETRGVYDETVDIDTLVFSKGDPVQVVTGPFEGFAGEVQRTPKGQRVSVLLKMLGAEKKAELDIASLRAA
jgi:transcription elongation factor/antiterminator RfaH